VEGYPLQLNEVVEVVERGEGRQALAVYERTASAAAQAGDRLLEARAQSATAFVAFRLGMLQKTILAGRRALELYRGETLSGHDVAATATVYAHVGNSYRNAGDPVQARRFYEEGLAFARAHPVHNREHIAIGYISHNLAALAHTQHDYPTARTYAEQAVDFFQDLNARTGAGAPEMYRRSIRRHVALSLTMLGHVELTSGRYDKAEAAFDRALKFARLVGLSEVEVKILAAQGRLALNRHDWPRALAIYQQAIAQATKIGKGGSMMWLHHGVARAQARLGHPGEALASARRAIEAVEEVRGELQETALRSGFLEDKQTIYQAAVPMALDAGDPAEAFAFAERGRARAFLDLLGNQTTLSKGRTRALVDEEVRLRARLAETQVVAQDTGDVGESRRARAELEAIDRDYRAFLERVRKESLEQASLMSVEPVSLSELQGLLPSGTTLLEYFVGGQDVILWVIDREHVTALRLPVRRDTLVTDVRQLREAITAQAPQADVEARALKLYRRLVDPARSAIRGDRLMIVPHDVLHYVPFAALRTPAGRWLIEEYMLATLPSASVLKYLVDKGIGASERTLAIGNPALGDALNLRYAEREARLIGQERPPATVLLREDASESQAKALLPTMGVIHFATHAELKEHEPLTSALLLVPGGGEDGRLEVRELFGLELNARLVVLSACETGLGELSRGDELVGLQRAFLYAGSPAVITTLWKVDDRATYELMRAFYRELRQGDPLPSLRRAQLATMQTLPHPFAWAAFGLTGVSR
jgi:CHAT domain-containing protein/tetratricopeptide (TPR) repeat protein